MTLILLKAELEKEKASIDTKNKISTKIHRFIRENGRDNEVKEVVDNEKYHEMKLQYKAFRNFRGSSLIGIGTFLAIHGIMSTLGWGKIPCKTPIDSIMVVVLGLLFISYGIDTVESVTA